MTGIVAGSGALAGVALGWWAVVALTASAVLFLALGKRDRAMVAVWLVAIAATAAGAGRAAQHEAPAAIGGALPFGDGAIVVTAPIDTGQRQHFVAELGTAGEDAGARHRVCVSAGPFPEARLGDEIRLYGASRAADDVAQAQRGFMAVRGCEATMFADDLVILKSRASPARALSEFRSHLNEVLRGAAPGDAGVLLSGLVTGDDAGFSVARQEAFIRTGTTHLTAVSGSNLALVAGMFAVVGGATVGRHRAAWQIVTVCGVWAYAMVSGAEAPAIRAAIVATAAILAFRVGRRPDFVTLVLLAAGAMALIDPGRVESLGFRLSVAASLALAVVLPPLLAQSRGSGIAAAVAATAAAQIATLPFLLPTFGAISITSVPANIVAAPLVAIAMPLAGLAGLAGLVWKPLGEAIAAPAVLAANALIAAVDRLGGPRAYVQVGTPPFAATAIIAATGCALLLGLQGGGPRRRSVWPFGRGATR